MMTAETIINAIEDLTCSFCNNSGEDRMRIVIAVNYLTDMLRECCNSQTLEPGYTEENISEFLRHFFELTEHDDINRIKSEGRHIVTEVIQAIQVLRSVRCFNISLRNH